MTEEVMFKIFQLVRQKLTKNNVPSPYASVDMHKGRRVADTSKRDRASPTHPGKKTAARDKGSPTLLLQ